MSETNGECIRGMESNREPLVFEQVLVGEDGEPLYLEGEEYGVFHEEEYIRLEDGTFVQANQHSLMSQASQSSEPQILQVQLPPVPQQMSAAPTPQFQAHHPIQQQQTYPAQIPSQVPHVPRFKSNLVKTTSVSEQFNCNVPQQSFDLLNNSSILSLAHVNSNISKPFSSSPSSSTVYSIPSTQTIQSKPRKKPLPGQRKPCNCTKSMCLKLYCDCFANGEFCLDCNCKDCHNNLEHDADRSKAIKQSLERNPNAFKPKIGVKSGKVDAERLHQKGCHCKKSGCLKNYCECFEAKVPCTSRCKCHGCQNTEMDRVNRNDRLAMCFSLLES
uniref:CRC domain-containing protein n=1 Tax=Angiostrongylus cantonensis TaxID=6313 RepID=A0A0K0CTA6_ANGCA